MSIDAINTSPDFDEVWPAAVGADVDIVATYGDFARQIRAGVGGTLADPRAALRPL